MDITVTLSAQEMQITRLALGIARKEALHDMGETPLSMYMTGEVAKQYEDIERKLYEAMLQELRKIKQGVA